MLIVQYPKVLDVVGYAGDTVSFIVPAPRLAGVANDSFAAFAHVKKTRKVHTPVTKFDVSRATDGAGNSLDALMLTLRPDVTTGLSQRRDLRRLPIPELADADDTVVVVGPDGSPPVMGTLPQSEASDEPLAFRRQAGSSTTVVTQAATMAVRPLGLGPSARRLANTRYNTPLGDAQEYGWAWQGVWDLELRVFEMVNNMRTSSISTLRSGTVAIFCDVTRDPV